MAETTDKEGMLLQNMQDAGCSNDMINRCITLVKRSRYLCHSYYLQSIGKHFSLRYIKNKKNLIVSIIWYSHWNTNSMKQ